MIKPTTLSSSQTTEPANAGPIDPSLLQIDKAPEKKKRTPGLWAVDVLIYPLVNNLAVFAISVFATYLTKHGDKHLGGFGRWMKRRGDNLQGWLTDKMGWSESAAETGKMVAFSFLDGTLMAPVVKGIEDQRENIAKGIDKALGVEVEDQSVYDAEPKRGWGSVLGGRAITALMVVPTAALLERTGIADGKVVAKGDTPPAGFKNFNDVMFQGWGDKLAARVERNPKLVGRLKSLNPEFNIPYFSKVAVFEAFYTSLCTAGLYFSSRIIAGFGGKKSAEKSVAAPVQSEKSDSSPSLVSTHQATDSVDKARHATRIPRRFQNGLTSREEKPVDFRTQYEERRQRDATLLTV